MILHCKYILGCIDAEESLVIERSCMLGDRFAALRQFAPCLSLTCVVACLLPECTLAYRVHTHNLFSLFLFGIITGTTQLSKSGRRFPSCIVNLFANEAVQASSGSSTCGLTREDQQFDAPKRSRLLRIYSEMSWKKSEAAPWNTQFCPSLEISFVNLI